MIKLIMKYNIGLIMITKPYEFPLNSNAWQSDENFRRDKIRITSVKAFLHLNLVNITLNSFILLSNNVINE